MPVFLFRDFQYAEVMLRIAIIVNLIAERPPIHGDEHVVAGSPPSNITLAAARKARPLRKHYATMR